jgi:hypothetical protein
LDIGSVDIAIDDIHVPEGGDHHMQIDIRMLSEDETRSLTEDAG